MKRVWRGDELYDLIDKWNAYLASLKDDEIPMTKEEFLEKNYPE